MKNTIALNNSFEIFVGIDQTGAALSNGQKAKPLPVAIVIKSSRLRMLLHNSAGQPLLLRSLSPDYLSELLDDQGLALGGHTALIADCVFGLPQAVWPKKLAPGLYSLWSLFRLAAENNKHRIGFGRNPAAQFFSDFLKNELHKETRIDLPKRACERLANANSVFQTHPFQKNIQCGTYRIWRDLGSYRKSEPIASACWLNIRHFTPLDLAHASRPWIFEAYPSLLWRNHLGLPHRQPDRLKEALIRLIPDLEISEKCLRRLETNPDAADAAVLAASGLILQRKKQLFPGAPSRSRRLAMEGWIIGLTEP